MSDGNAHRKWLWIPGLLKLTMDDGGKILEGGDVSNDTLLPSFVYS